MFNLDGVENSSNLTPSLITVIFSGLKNLKKSKRSFLIKLLLA